MDRDLQTILISDNPWLENPAALEPWLRGHVPRDFVPRTQLAHAEPRWSDAGRAHLVIGPRQAGKSTAIWAYLAEVGERVLHVDCELALVQEWCRAAPLFLADLEELVGGPVAVFFDEVQHLANAGLFLEGLVDRRPSRPILVSGCSSYHLGSKVRESLAGRATRVRLLPFSFEEVCGDLAGASPVARSRELARRFERHAAVGGYPDVWLGDRPDLLLADLVEAFVLRDASDLYNIARPDAFRRLLRLAARQVGSLVNLAEWAAVLGISRDTVAAYLEILEESHVVVALPPFVGGRRSELTRTPKIYLVDPGIRNRLLGDLRVLDERTDAGPALESWVFSELWKALPADGSLHYWRSTSKAEVDFVVARGDLLVGVEVKAGRLGRPTLPRAARSFIEAYRPALFLVVNRGFTATDRLDETEVRWLEPVDLVPAVNEGLRTSA